MIGLRNARERLRLLYGPSASLAMRDDAGAVVAELRGAGQDGRVRVIVDDERLARNELRRMVEVAGGVELIGEAKNATSDIRAIAAARSRRDVPGQRRSFPAISTPSGEPMIAPLCDVCDMKLANLIVLAMAELLSSSAQSRSDLDISASE